jgi:hypothetical protein
MIPTRTDHLSTIKTFPDLIRYLEHELDWPLAEYGFDRKARLHHQLRYQVSDQQRCRRG